MSKFASLLRRYIVVLSLTTLALLLGIYYWSLHRKPFTQNAFTIANTRPVSPLVEGYLTEVTVKNHQRVKKGEKLFTTFRPPYELKVRQLEAAVAAQQAKSAGLAAQIRVAEAKLRAAMASSDNRAYLSRQAALMYGGKAVSQTYAEETRRAELAAAAELDAAKHTIEATRRAMDESDAEVKRLGHELALARIYLEQTTVYALTDGVISNMLVSPGGYYRPGDVLFAFIEDGDWYVQANFEETDLSEIRPGQTASVWLWQYPGKRFNAVVESMALSAERRTTAKETGVQIVQKENQWFMLPQRFPVQLKITDPDPDYPFNLGGSAFVQIDTSAQLFRQILWRVFRWE